jgi:HK97 family phage prohead protease
MQYPKLSGSSADKRVVTKRATVQLSSVRKFVANSGKRRISGVASSISPDRELDIVVPTGGRWKLPIPLLHQHSHGAPLGKVTEVEVRGNDLWFEAEVAEGIARVDEVWGLIEQGALDSLSIGFRGVDWDPLPGGGRRYTKWELLEISVVAVAMHPEAKIRNAGVVRESIPGHPGAVRLPTKAPELSIYSDSIPGHAGAVKLHKLPAGAVRILQKYGRPPSTPINQVPGHPGSIRLDGGSR